MVGDKGLVMIMNLLQGERAAKFRAGQANVLVGYLGGNLSLIKEVPDIRQTQEMLPEDHAARVFREHVESTNLGVFGEHEGLGETAEQLAIIV